jgi:hypothetical protein
MNPPEIILLTIVVLALIFAVTWVLSTYLATKGLGDNLSKCQKVELALRILQTGTQRDEELTKISIEYLKSALKTKLKLESLNEMALMLNAVSPSHDD